MKMQKQQFRIGQLAKLVDVERFVIRFWEKEFGIKSHRSTGGQRFYTEKELAMFEQIKTLLYDRKFTIEGAKQELKHRKNVRTIIASSKTTMNDKELAGIPEDLKEKIVHLQNQLIKLKELL
jgi:DNA-binding transcriptional MerR regulator